MATIARLRVTNLLLDAENPRLGKPDQGSRWTQNSILQQFASHAKVQSLGEDIATKGLNPSKRPIVMPAADKAKSYTVLEGNRRLAAVRLIGEPRLAGEGSSAAKTFRSLAKHASKMPDEVECVIVKNREEADHWIRMEHGLGKDGTSTLEWGPSEKSRYQERVHGEGRYSKSTALVDTLADTGMLDPAMVRKMPITTLDRLLNDPEFRSGLGLDFEDIAITDSNRGAILRVLTDLATGTVKVDKVKTKSLRGVYLADVLANPTPIATSPITTKKGSQRSRVQRPDHARKYLIPSDFKPTIKQKRLKEIYEELRSIPVEEYPNAVSMMFRCFVDLAVWDFYRRRSWTLPGKLATAVKKTAEVLVKEGHITDGLKSVVARAADEDDSFMSVKALHQFVDI